MRLVAVSTARASDRPVHPLATQATAAPSVSPENASREAIEIGDADRRGRERLGQRRIDAVRAPSQSVNRIFAIRKVHGGQRRRRIWIARQALRSVSSASNCASVSRERAITRAAASDGLEALDQARGAACGRRRGIVEFVREPRRETPSEIVFSSC